MDRRGLIVVNSKHIREKHDPPLPCPVGCGSTKFPNSKMLHRHIRVEHPSFAADPKNGIPEDGGVCPYPECNREFTRQDNLKRHIEEQHTGQRKRVRKQAK